MAHKQSEILCSWYGKLPVDVILGDGYWIRKACNRKMRRVEKTACRNATQRGRGKEFSFHWQKTKTLEKSDCKRRKRNLCPLKSPKCPEVFRSIRRDGIYQSRRMDRVGKVWSELLYIYWAFKSSEYQAFFSAWSVF